MSLPHFFAGAPQPGERVVLPAEDARHAAGSLRLREGDRFSSADGDGAVAVCRIVRVDRGTVEAEVEERQERPRARPLFTVLLAPPKGERLAWAVQKLTELGTDAIVLIEAERSVRRWTGDRAVRVANRLSGVAREAAKQARRMFLPAISGPVSWTEAIARAAAEGPVVVLWERAQTGLSELLPLERPDVITVVVGPEGGIGEEDASGAAGQGALLASLGEHPLRVETAALAAAAVILSRYGRLG